MIMVEEISICLLQMGPWGLKGGMRLRKCEGFSIFISAFWPSLAQSACSA